MSQHTTRVFKNGNSQAVRIPAAYRLDTDYVSIVRNEQGDLVLHPLPSDKDRGAALLDALNGFDESFVAALEAGRSEQPPAQDRDDL
jgi:antitoxin VapB